MDFTLGFIGGAIWTSLGITFLLVWLFCRWSVLLAAKNRDIRDLENKYRSAIEILRDRDDRAA
jgi:hypothetical protein